MENSAIEKEVFELSKLQASDSEKSDVVKIEPIQNLPYFVNDSSNRAIKREGILAGPNDPSFFGNIDLGTASLLPTPPGPSSDKDIFGLQPFGLFSSNIGSIHPLSGYELYPNNGSPIFPHTRNFQSDAIPVGQMSSRIHAERMRELEELYTKLNPFAKEFVPPSAASKQDPKGNNHQNSREKKKPSQSQRLVPDDSVKKTVYVGDIDKEVTEEQLASLFFSCGEVVDCRICGDPNSALRFAFVEFTDELGAQKSLKLAGTVLGSHALKVVPSKTPIVPVNPVYLPKTEDELDLCSKTVYCANIDKSVTQTDIRLFFESLCGQVSKLRLLGDYHHTSRIAFVEFVQAESAAAALNCSGAVLGTLPLRISPSKTPVRSRPRTNSSSARSK